MLNLPNIPSNSILGLNYSGMHDTAIAIVSPEGDPIYAVSLERLSRVKQDGRPFPSLVEEIPWGQISCTAISAPMNFIQPENVKSILHPWKLSPPRDKPLLHESFFNEYLEGIPSKKIYVGHQESHVASAFWGSGFSESLCLTYDGGMSNDPWFGGLFKCTRDGGIVALDQFSAQHYAKVTSLYTFVTGLLGFTPNKHEGKLTGLAAYGVVNRDCLEMMYGWLESSRYYEMESAITWVNAYSKTAPPMLSTNAPRLHAFEIEASKFRHEDMAAAVQFIAEKHILQILEGIKNIDWSSENICLAGGLFANVKINQRVSELGFKSIFVAPPMTDDGVALGAALYAAYDGKSFNPPKYSTMFLGPTYGPEIINSAVHAKKIKFEVLEKPAERIATLLASGSSVAIFQGGGEFGPRALGNRSILASASDPKINETLNALLNRTEFMPFAPMTRAEDAELCYAGIEKIRHTAEFMTITVNCTDLMKETCPAVVHVDGTARPQLVTKDSNPLIHQILSEYKNKTGLMAIVNTSFNIHEEPIVCTPEDALQGFFESGLDYLYVEHLGLISFSENPWVAVAYLQEKIRKPSQKISLLNDLIKQLQNSLLVSEKNLHDKHNALMTITSSAVDKENVIQDFKKEVSKIRTALELKHAALMDMTESAREKEVVILRLKAELKVK